MTPTNPSRRNIVWTVLFSTLLVVTLNACGVADNGLADPLSEPLSQDAKLSSLMVSDGSLDPAFSSDVANYSVEVATSITRVTVAAQAQDPGASVSIDGQTTTNLLVPLNEAGGKSTISIVVTAPNGNQNTYIVKVTRDAAGGNNRLQSLSVSPGSLAPEFNPSTISYTANVANTVDHITVAAQAQDPGAMVSIQNQPMTSLSVSLDPPGGPTFISIDVTAPNGSRKTFAVRVNRAAPLTITTTSLPDGTVGTPYSQQLQATGGSGPLTWSRIGLLPRVIISAEGLISAGTNTAGLLEFTAQVTDSQGQSATQGLSIEINNK